MRRKHAQIYIWKKYANILTNRSTKNDSLLNIFTVIETDKNEYLFWFFVYQIISLVIKQPSLESYEVTALKCLEFECETELMPEIEWLLQTKGPINKATLEHF